MKSITIKRVAIATLAVTAAATAVTFVKHLVNHSTKVEEEPEYEDDETEDIVPE